MRVLIVGSGGREGALARAIYASKSFGDLLIAPGNPGTSSYGTNLAVAADDVSGLVTLAKERAVDLVVVGPELPLALGLADALGASAIPCFGPRAAAARIETSKAFAKTFMESFGIPTPSARVFTDIEAATRYASSLPRLPVIKASGLSAGKGVFLPEDRQQLGASISEAFALGGMAPEVLVEERLEGEELSILAFSDGQHWSVMPPARDHKRLLERDRGPNTGGMGAYAPAASMEIAEALAKIVIAPAIEGLAAEGAPFVGALYAGIMLCADGPRVLEYNCRFGDPEAQAILPLYDGDLLDLLLAASSGRLGEIKPRWKRGSAASIVIASEGYPDSPTIGRPLELPSTLPTYAWIHEASCSIENGQLVSSGGRVANAVGWGEELDQALGAARAVASMIKLEGSTWRRDIGLRGHLDEAARASLSARVKTIKDHTNTDKPGIAAPRAPGASVYALSGVDIDAGNRAVELMKASLRSTYGPEVLAGLGSFGALFDASALKAMKRPVLVASTDGVGTKASLGLALGRLRGLGMDIVNHSIDDILVQGGRPLFFLDYIAASKIKPEAMAEIVAGMAEACKASGCALIGGETAEMPGTYREGEIDIAGTIVGVVEGERALPRLNLEAGDLIVGLQSSGLHTNGYSLARRAIEGLDLESSRPELGESLADCLLRPHRSYLGLLGAALDSDNSPIKALAHITGGGILENIPRVLPKNVDAIIRRGSWRVPPIFGFIKDRTGASEEECYRVLNQGIGMVIVVAAKDLELLRSLVPANLDVIGELESGEGRVQLR